MTLEFETVPLNSITTNVSSTGICQGGTVTVAYMATGTFNAGNTFTAQLSNASGSFTNPVAIGSITSTVSGSITATIPAGTAAGTDYRIRVLSSNPAVTGSDNGNNLTINPRPTATISGSTTCRDAPSPVVTFTGSSGTAPTLLATS